jgi:hypothetical protein
MNAPKPKLDIDTTRERLAALGCSHAAEHLDQVLSDADPTPVVHPDEARVLGLSALNSVVGPPEAGVSGP